MTSQQEVGEEEHRQIQVFVDSENPGSVQTVTPLRVKRTGAQTTNDLVVVVSDWSQYRLVDKTSGHSPRQLWHLEVGLAGDSEEGGPGERG